MWEILICILLSVISSLFIGCIMAVLIEDAEEELEENSSR